MHRIGTLPGSLNDFVLLVKGVPAPIEVALAYRYFALELERQTSVKTSLGRAKAEGSRLLLSTRGILGRFWSPKTGPSALYRPRKVL